MVVYYLWSIIKMIILILFKSMFIYSYLSVKLYVFNLGITCPSGERPNQGDQPSAAEEYHQEALAFTKEKIMHREVEITVESCNKGGSMIGWLFIGNTNLSLALVKEGLAKVHRSAERSDYFKQLQQAEKEAKDKKINVIFYKYHVCKVYINYLTIF